LRSFLTRSAILFLFATTCFALHAAQADAPSQAPALMAGEYTDPAEPDTPLDVYMQGGKLFVESERFYPTELSVESGTRYRLAGSHDTLLFTLDNAGRGSTLVSSATPEILYQRTGDAVRHIFHNYQRSEVMIPMRDGVKLHAVILRPSDITTPMPFLMQRTPYGVEDTSAMSFVAQRPELASDGYIYVAEDIRGRFKSEGKFVMMHPLADHRKHKAIDESTDTYDTVAWLLEHVSGNNGRVGVLGTSYPGFLAMMAGIDPHPAVKAISPQAPMIDVWIGDDFFHNGAFRQSYGFDYGYMMESNKENADIHYGKNQNDAGADGYNYFLERGSFEQDVKRSGSKLLPTWKIFLDHPEYSSDWSSRAVEQWLTKVTVPTLTVGGYYDQEDMWGPQEEYAKLEPHDAHQENFLVLGPWRHGSWNSSARYLGNLQYGEPIGKEFRARIEAKFFAHYLKDQPGFELEDTASFQTGSNLWKYYPHFPPAQSKATSLYLSGGGVLSWSASTDAQTSYLSDPSNPVPYRHRPIQPTYGPGSRWYNWLTEDQRFVTDRKDVAVWKLPVERDVTLTGEVVADIYATTTGTDNDMVVKLIDEYPNDDLDAKMAGYQLIINAEIFRGRYLQSFTSPQPVKSDTVCEYRFSLHDVDHVFKAGHTIMVEIQSSWFPLYDRNPQTFVPNIMKAGPADYRPATITIDSGPGHASQLIVPMMPN
jgi:uncharacterized protein